VRLSPFLTVSVRPPAGTGVPLIDADPFWTIPDKSSDTSEAVNVHLAVIPQGRGLETD